MANGLIEPPQPAEQDAQMIMDGGISRLQAQRRLVMGHGLFQQAKANREHARHGMDRGVIWPLLA